MDSPPGMEPQTQFGHAGIQCPAPVAGRVLSKTYATTARTVIKQALRRSRMEGQGLVLGNGMLS